MSTRATRFDLETPSAHFEVSEDVLLCPGEPRLLVEVRLKHDKRGNEYGNMGPRDAACGVFYVHADDFAALCRRFLAQHEPVRICEHKALSGVMTQTRDDGTRLHRCANCGDYVDPRAVVTKK